MSSRKIAPSNLEYLIRHEVLQEGTTLEDAICILTDPLNCEECIAVDQCAERYGSNALTNPDHDCMEVVAAFLKQDYKEVKKT
ncbi:MAG: hypothetical protein HDR09_13040 [Lachnospiraceae bacterium]|nr:hypothetical protein [Lachnospiraceae bacterium]